MSAGEGEASLARTLREELGDALESVRTVQKMLTLRVKAEHLARVCAALRERHGFTRLVDLCGVDLLGRTPRFEVVYQLCDPAAGRWARLKVAAGAETPVPSVTGVWRGADWLEREAWDLFGIRFEGHPGLARLLLWEEFEGHPLRKDFPLEGHATGTGEGTGE